MIVRFLLFVFFVFLIIKFWLSVEISNEIGFLILLSVLICLGLSLSGVSKLSKVLCLFLVFIEKMILLLNFFWNVLKFVNGFFKCGLIVRLGNFVIFKLFFVVFFCIFFEVSVKCG